MIQLCHCLSKTFILVKLINYLQNYVKATKAQLRDHCFQSIVCHVEDSSVIGLINVNDLKHLIIFLWLVIHESRALNIDVFILLFLPNLLIIHSESW